MIVGIRFDGAGRGWPILASGRPFVGLGETFGEDLRTVLLSAAAALASALVVARVQA